MLIASLLGVICQDVSLFLLAKGDAQPGAAALGLQGLVLAVAVGLVMLSRKATARGWIAGSAA